MRKRLKGLFRRLNPMAEPFEMACQALMGAHVRRAAPAFSRGSRSARRSRRPDEYPGYRFLRILEIRRCRGRRFVWRLPNQSRKPEAAKARPPPRQTPAGTSRRHPASPSWATSGIDLIPRIEKMVRIADSVRARSPWRRIRPGRSVRVLRPLHVVGSRNRRSGGKIMAVHSFTKVALAVPMALSALPRQSGGRPRPARPLQNRRRHGGAYRHGDGWCWQTHHWPHRQ